MRTSISVLLGVLIGLGCISLRPAGGGTSDPDSLTTKRLRIVDDQNRLSVVIEKSSIRFLAPGGQIRMWLQLNEDNEGDISIMDSTGRIRARMDVTSEYPSIAVFGDGKSSARLLYAEDVVGLFMADQTGVQTLSAIGTPGPRFALHDTKGKTLVELIRKETGGSSILIRDDGQIVGEFRPQDHMAR